MKCVITNKKRGKKPGESDAFFWEDLLNEPPEPFTDEELAIWDKAVGLSSIIKKGNDNSIDKSSPGGDAD
jgi:hypothetical protein